MELVGWIGAEPEQRFTPSGTAVCNFRVATNRFGGRNEAGERIVEAEWTTVEAWEKLAEQCGRFLHKGSRVRVIGRLDEMPDALLVYDADAKWLFFNEATLGFLNLDRAVLQGLPDAVQKRIGRNEALRRVCASLEAVNLEPGHVLGVDERLADKHRKQ